ncbi:hypothetical protein B0H17DRAFT_1142095 [Mycena rosella]|uniref:Uncharacterized protein n=1 Tax=Mycena rosella TaxID=1033263 RepID=A0AAD7CYE5_MYCRO|nr:hypothetical protein B0H17DRAFT_1142095 [Mycena rosella]
MYNALGGIQALASPRTRKAKEAQMPCAPEGPAELPQGPDPVGLDLNLREEGVKQYRVCQVRAGVQTWSWIFSTLETRENHRRWQKVHAAVQLSYRKRSVGNELGLARICGLEAFGPIPRADSETVYKRKDRERVLREGEKERSPKTDEGRITKHRLKLAISKLKIFEFIIRDIRLSLSRYLVSGASRYGLFFPQTEQHSMLVAFDTLSIDMTSGSEPGDIPSVGSDVPSLSSGINSESNNGWQLSMNGMYEGARSILELENRDSGVKNRCSSSRGGTSILIDSGKTSILEQESIRESPFDSRFDFPEYGLVSKVWLPASRSHPFHSIQVTLRKATRWNAFLKSSHLTAYLRHVKLFEKPELTYEQAQAQTDKVYELLPHIAQLTTVQSLCVDVTSWVPAFRNVIRHNLQLMHILSHFTLLERVSLTRVKVKDFEEIPEQLAGKLSPVAPPHNPNIIWQSRAWAGGLAVQFVSPHFSPAFGIVRQAFLGNHLRGQPHAAPGRPIIQPSSLLSRIRRFFLHPHAHPATVQPNAPDRAPHPRPRPVLGAATLSLLLDAGSAIHIERGLDVTPLFLSEILSALESLALDINGELSALNALDWRPFARALDGPQLEREHANADVDGRPEMYARRIVQVIAPVCCRRRRLRLHTMNYISRVSVLATRHPALNVT